MKLSNVLLGLTGCFFAASLSGCFVVTSDDPPPVAGTGSVTVELSLDGRASESECDYFNVDALHVEVVENGATVVATDSDCYHLGVTIDNLPPGRYSVEASLLKHGATVSDIISKDDALVTRDTELHIPVDFPANWIH